MDLASTRPLGYAAIMSTLFKSLRSRVPEEVPERSPSPEILDITRYLSAHQVEALSFLLQGSTPRQVASKMGVKLATVRSWMTDDDFKWAMNYSRAEIMQHSVDALRVAQNAAVTLMLDVIQDPSEPTTTRIRAAGKVLDITTKHGGMPTLPTEDSARSVEEELRALADKDPDVTELLLALDERMQAARDEAGSG